MSFVGTGSFAASATTSANASLRFGSPQWLATLEAGFYVARFLELRREPSPQPGAEIRIGLNVLRVEVRDRTLDRSVALAQCRRFG